MSLFTLGSARAVLVVALIYSFPEVFNVIMALISPYTNRLTRVVGLFKIILVGTGVQLKLRKHPNAYILLSNET
jgi:hypothetical protein